MKKQIKSLNDRIGEFFFYSVLRGDMDSPPQFYLEVKDGDGNPVEVKFKKAKKEERE